jgi:hypothetical protein
MALTKISYPLRVMNKVGISFIGLSHKYQNIQREPKRLQKTAYSYNVSTECRGGLGGASALCSGGFVFSPRPGPLAAMSRASVVFPSTDR